MKPDETRRPGHQDRQLRVLPAQQVKIASLIQDRGRLLFKLARSLFCATLLLHPLYRPLVRLNE